jgi:hypothetical protein
LTGRGRHALQIRRAVSSEDRRSSSPSGQTAKQPFPEHRIIGNLSGLAEKTIKHDAGNWRLAQGGVAVYSQA